jgi:hypothetical protein
MDYLRKRGWWPAVAERWNPFSRTRHDLYGILDIVAINPRLHATMGIQATTGDHVAERIEKVRNSPALYQLMECGWLIEVWGWEKKRSGWALRRERFVKLQDDFMGGEPPRISLESAVVAEDRKHEEYILAQMARSHDMYEVGLKDQAIAVLKHERRWRADNVRKRRAERAASQGAGDSQPPAKP